LAKIRIFKKILKSLTRIFKIQNVETQEKDVEIKMKILLLNCYELKMCDITSQNGFNVIIIYLF